MREGGAAGHHRAAEDNAKALNAAAVFEIDDVIDPAETRSLVAATLAAASAAPRERRPRRFVDTGDRSRLTADAPGNT